MTAYGYDIVFAHTPSDEGIDKTICLIDTLALNIDEFSHMADYENNHGRELQLLLKKNTTNTNTDKILLFRVKEYIDFSWDVESQNIYYKISEDTTKKQLDFWIYHILLPIFFSVSKTYYYLHCAAVEVENALMGFIGPSYAGKSTLTDYFLKKDHALITDDKLATYVDDGFYALGSYQYHRPYRAFEDMGYKVDNFKKGPFTLKVLYYIYPVEGSAEITFEEIKGVRKFSLLREQSEIKFNSFLVEATEYLSALANKIDLYQITVPRDMDRLDEVYLALREHFSKTN